MSLLVTSERRRCPQRLHKKVSVLLRYGKIAGGFLLLAAGIAMIALPGPGWLTIFAALAILAGEFLWARKLLDRLKSQVNRLRHRSTS